MMLNKPMAIANTVTLIRMALLPIVIYSIFQESEAWALFGLILFVFMVFSEYIIHRSGQKDNSFLDPFSDKVMIICLLIVFLAQGTFGIFPLLVFILRDFVVNGIRTIGSRYDIVLTEDVYGKATKVVQYFILLFLFIKDYLLYGSFEDELIALADSGLYVFILLGMLLVVFSMGFFGYTCWKAVNLKKTEGKEVEESKMLVLANSKSRGYHDGLRRRLLRLFVRKRKAELHYISPHGGMFEEHKKIIPKFPLIVVAGGDGSFESALNYAPLKRKALGFFPLGAGNAFYSYFYKGKGFAYLGSKFQFKEKMLDILELEWEKGKRQTLFSSIGIDAEVIRLTKERTVRGFWDYFNASLKSIVKARSDYDFELVIDGKKQLWENCCNITLAKVPYYGYGMRSLLHYAPDDGRVYGLGIVNKHSSILNKFLRAWCLVLAPLRLEHPPLVSISGKEITLRSEVPFPIQAGGEFLGYSQWLKVRVVRQQRVLVV